MNLLLVGRSESKHVFEVLDGVASQKSITKITSSGRPGSPTFAVRWAIKHCLPRALVPQDDVALLKEKPDLILYFNIDSRDESLIQEAERQGIICYRSK